MRKDQKYIYYASGKTLESIKLLPEMEKFRKDGTDVLLMASSIDEFAVMLMHDYDKTEFKSISQAAKDDLSKEEKDKLDSLTASHQRILDDIKEILKGKVDDVTLSTKLVEAPVCISTKEGVSLNMEHVINEEPGAENLDDNQKPKAVKVLEINPDNELFKTIAQLKDDEDIKDYGKLLYDEAMMLEGFEVEDKKSFVQTLNSIVLKKGKAE
jgi:molecular chaperone HtpG